MRMVVQVFLVLVFFGLTVAGFVYAYTNRETHTSPQVSAATGPTISTIIVPHFDFAKTERQNLLQSLRPKTNPLRIIIVSVNHYNVGDADIITTTRNWDFASGKPIIDIELAKNLITDKTMLAADAPFINEHGISTVFPDVLANFPQSTYLPIIIKDTTPKSTVDHLLTQLRRYCDSCLLVASIDFSHYNPNSLAQIHDVMSLRALSDMNPTLGWQSETDSPQTMYLSIEWGRMHQTNHFHLTVHDNSGNATNNDDVETTSYVLGYYSNSSNGASVQPDTTTFLIGGDLMFDRGINHQFKSTGLQHVFDDFGQRVFWGSDVALANLEGPISAIPINDDTTANNLMFNFPPESIQALQFLHVNAVSSANNHSLNAGQNGLDTTKKLLSNAGIVPIGQQDQFNQQSLHQFDNPNHMTIIAVNMLENPAQQPILDAIASEHLRGHFVMIFPHWGVEYQPTHSAEQQQQAYAWIEAGADAIIGSHPHVIEDMEIYHGKPIIYSLGNLVFDQTFSPDTQKGLLIGGVITKEALQLSFFPTQTKSLKPHLASGNVKSEILQHLLPVDNEHQYEKVRSDTIRIKR